MALEVFSRLTRTLQFIFRIGDILIKDNSGIVQMRESTDTAFADLAVNQIRVHGDNNTDAIILDAPSGLSSTQTFVLPETDGASGDALITDGSGNLSFVSSAGAPNSHRTIAKQFTEADGLSFALFTPDVGTVIWSIVVRVDVDAVNPGPPVRVAIGTAASNEEYFEFKDSDIERLRTYERILYADVIGAPDPIIATVQNNNSKTFTATVFITYVIPTFV